MALQTQSLSFSHPGQPTIHFPDFRVDSQNPLLILGKSGSGKTTLLHLLCGLIRPKSGKVTLGNTVLSELSESQLDRFRGEKIGIVFQKPHLIAALNVRQNLELVPYFSKKKGKSAEELLSDLNLLGKKESSVLTLSEGEAQRVSIARALANSPELILADEPTSSLDDDHAEKVIRLLMDQSAKIGAILIIVTHDQRVKNQITNFIEVKTP